MKDLQELLNALDNGVKNTSSAELRSNPVN